MQILILQGSEPLVTMPFLGFGWCTCSLPTKSRWNRQRYSMSPMGTIRIPLCPIYVILALPYPHDQTLFSSARLVTALLSLKRKSLKIQQSWIKIQCVFFFFYKHLLNLSKSNKCFLFLFFFPYKLLLNLYGKANGLQQLNKFWKKGAKLGNSPYLILT